jgi:hypothetical protein
VKLLTCKKSLFFGIAVFWLLARTLAIAGLGLPNANNDFAFLPHYQPGQCLDPQPLWVAQYIYAPQLIPPCTP